jgi:purine-binding chemotaxis protein CheW
MEAVMTDAKSGTMQYLTFVLGGEVFALEIESVREVLELTRITRVPRMPEAVRGVINLRGHAVPVVDLRRLFRLGDVADTVETCIIIAEVELGEDTVQVGALVDSVREVFDMDATEIMPPPRMGTKVRAEFMTGMGRQGEAFVMILDIGRILGSGELAALADLAGEGGGSQETVGGAVPGGTKGAAPAAQEAETAATA